jgi:hypothetical protein
VKRLSVVGAFAIVLLGLVSPALAKGPSQAVIEGPGLESPISLRPPGQPTIGPRLATMVEQSGFFFGLSSQRSERKRIRFAGELGPRYTVTYTLNGPARPDAIKQHVYPYASQGPLTYMPRGQKYWNGEQTTGGWHEAPVALKEMLVKSGLPRTPPTEASPSPGFAHFRAATLAALLVAFTLAIAVIARRSGAFAKFFGRRARA